MEISGRVPGMASGWADAANTQPFNFPFLIFFSCSINPTIALPQNSVKIHCRRFVGTRGESGSPAHSGRCPAPTLSGLGQAPLPPASPELWLQPSPCAQVTHTQGRFVVYLHVYIPEHTEMYTIYTYAYKPAGTKAEDFPFPWQTRGHHASHLSFSSPWSPDLSVVLLATLGPQDVIPSCLQTPWNPSFFILFSSLRA